jgi:heme exporter protein A
MSPPTTSPDLLSVSNLSFYRNDEKIFGPLSFSLPAKHALLIEGGNGSGKTTLLRVVAGLLSAYSGEIHFSGKPIDSYSKQTFAYLGHKPCHKADLTCSENLEYFQKITGQIQSDTLPIILAKVGLSGFEDTPAQQLSAGQSKRLALSRILISQMPIWLLDEPYANLDLNGIALVNRLIKEHIDDQQGAVLITTHGAYAAPSVPCTTLQLSSTLS